MDIQARSRPRSAPQARAALQPNDVLRAPVEWVSRIRSCTPMYSAVSGRVTRQARESVPRAVESSSLLPRSVDAVLTDDVQRLQ